MATEKSRLLVLLLVVVAAPARVVAAYTEGLICLEPKMSNKSKPLFFSLSQEPRQPAKSIRFTAPTSDIKWDALFLFENLYDKKIPPPIQMEIKKFKAGALLYHLQVFTNTSTQTMINHRLGKKWLDNGGQATVYVNNTMSSLTIIFQNPNEHERKLLIELTDPEIKGIDAVKVVGALEVELCSEPEIVSETTTTTTTPATTEDFTTNATLFTTEGESPSTKTVTGLGGDAECKAVPLWGWVFVGLAVMLFLFNLIFVAYHMAMRKSN